MPTLKSFGGLNTPDREEAMKMALRRKDLDVSHRWRKELAQNEETIRLSAIGAGVIGDPFLIPWLMEQIKIPPLARIAGEAFIMITGVDIAYEDLKGEWPEGFETVPTENPEDENVKMALMKTSLGRIPNWSLAGGTRIREGAKTGPDTFWGSQYPQHISSKS